MSRAARDLATVDRVFDALAHAARRQILLVLHHRGGAMVAGDIAQRFDCAWPTTTRHLKVLVDAGLVTKTRSGRQQIYRLEAQELARIAGGWLAHFD